MEKEYELANTQFNSKKFCSRLCADRYANKSKRDKRERNIKDVTVDNDITLEKLYKRDKGICWLCGTKCNKKDYVVTDATIICGNSYPSIDHVIPLSKGGRHSWDNIKLAHRLCNSIKSNKITAPGVKISPKK